MNTDYYVKQWEDIYLRDPKYTNMSTSELQQIVNNNARKVMMVPDSDLSTLIKLTAESKACRKIWERKIAAEKAAVEAEKRKEARIRQEAQKQRNTKTTWKNNRKKSERDAIAELKNVYSANGQLIFAILEEEGDKTIDEIANWCPELQMIENTEIKKVLEEFCKLKLVKKTDENKYQLLYFTYDSPYKLPWCFKGKEDFCKQIIASQEYNNENIILFVFAHNDELIFANEFPELIKKLSNDKSIANKNENFICKLNDLAKYDTSIWEKELQAMCKKGILCEPKKGAFYFPIISKK